MGYNKHAITSPDKFVTALLKQDRARFENDVLKCEVSRIEAKNSHRETMIKYFWKVNGAWVEFYFFCSKSVMHIVEDFRYECRSLKIA